jgi:hypothetical protein
LNAASYYPQPFQLCSGEEQLLARLAGGMHFPVGFKFLEPRGAIFSLHLRRRLILFQPGF